MDRTINMTGFKYYFTSYGDVYAGWEYPDTRFPDYRIVIQGTKRADYSQLPQQKRTLENISEYGWALPNRLVERVLDSNEFTPPETSYFSSDNWSNDRDRKVMFIIGAGASANCVYGHDREEFKNDKLRPPLGQTLFEKRFKDYYARYKGVNQILPHLQDVNSNIEDLFEQEWKNILNSGDQSVLPRHINIQYYLQEVLRDVSKKVLDSYHTTNLYKKLASKLQRIYVANVRTSYRRNFSKNFAFVSFNQDSILDTILSEQFNQPLNSMDDYVNVNENAFCLFKPHGSWNWGWKFPSVEVFQGKTSDWLFNNSTNNFQIYYQLLGNYVAMIDWKNTFGTEYSIHRNSLGKFTINKSLIEIIKEEDLSNHYPALLLPYRDKDEFIMPLRHFYNMQFYFSYIETLVIIGWKGNEESFNRQLIEREERIKKIIIADPQYEIVIENLRNLITKRNIQVITYSDFEDFVNNGIENVIM